MPERILLVEDDDEIAGLVQLHLGDQGYTVERLANGARGLETALREDYELVILDIMLPGLDGLEICKRLRADKPQQPILMLTAKSEEFDKVLGLELGADDYVTKPFGVREFIARVRALMRRAHAGEEEDAQHTDTIVCADLEIDLDKRKVTLAEERLDLTSKEFDLLALFASKPGRVYSREQLLERVWGYQSDGYRHTVNSHINRLRSKIEKDPAQPRFIKTVWGVGYRFAEAEEWEHGD
ncbi:MAG: two-component system alkaline phosphatase synthesis response regulator PhoP [Candidatus Latescibacterota bacterium]|jgi:two-component system alkaline phosphatase synthesis response regulator PhoP